MVPSPGRGVALLHPGVPSPHAKGPPVLFPLPGLGKTVPHGARRPLVQERLRNLWLLPDPGAGGPQGSP